MIHTLHRMAQGCCVCHLMSTHEVCVSPSTLSPPFPSTSPSFHSFLTSCTSSCTSSTTLRAVASLRTSPECRWTLLLPPHKNLKTKKTTISKLKTEKFKIADWKLENLTLNFCHFCNTFGTSEIIFEFLHQKNQ